MSCASNLVIIGCGNLSRADDGAGILAARELCAIGIPALEHSTDGVALLDLWADADEVILIDATRSGQAPGAVTEWDATAQPLPSRLTATTHGFGVAEAVELARILGRLPRRVYVYGIEGASFEPLAAMSPAVRQAVAQVVERIATTVCADRSA